MIFCPQYAGEPHGDQLATKAEQIGVVFISRIYLEMYSVMKLPAIIMDCLFP